MDILDFHTLFGPVPPRGVSVSGTGKLQALITQHGIVRAVALSTRGLYHNAAAGNRETVALCQQAANQLVPAGVLDPRLPQSETTVGGAKVLCILPATQNYPVNFAPLVDAMLALMQTGGAATANIPVWWEASRPGDATAIGQMVKALNYPAPVVLGGVTGDGLNEAVSVAKRSDRFYVATERLRGVGEIGAAIASLGAQKVVFASGAPARSLGAALAVVRQAGLSDSDAALVLGGNARRLLAEGGAA